jgi:hypothetical protein
MYRKPIFDAVRIMLKRGFSKDEVDALDRACDLAEAAVDRPPPTPPRPKVAASTAFSAPSAHVLGSLSEEFESGGRGPGTVSTGAGDAGGVSYGTYQLASKTGTCRVFVRSEGKTWAGRFASHPPGTAQFSAAWKAIAAAEPEAFSQAQHAFIERTLYRPVVNAVNDRKGVDLDKRCDALRDVVWSCAVQHGGAANILIEAIDNVERDTDRSDPTYDRKLIEEIYKARIAYVLAVASNPKRSQAERNQLISITRNRYPRELEKARAMLDGVASSPRPLAAGSGGEESIDGNKVAKSVGIAVKSASVKIGKLHPKMEPVIYAVAQCTSELGLPQSVITSGNDSKHMKGSLHYRNRALDFRGNNLKVAVGRKLAECVAAILGPDYDVAFEVFENPSNNHLHVEYDPD